MHQFRQCGDLFDSVFIYGWLFALCIDHVRTLDQSGRVPSLSVRRAVQAKGVRPKTNSMTNSINI